MAGCEMERRFDGDERMVVLPQPLPHLLPPLSRFPSDEQHAGRAPATCPERRHEAVGLVQSRSCVVDDHDQGRDDRRQEHELLRLGVGDEKPPVPPLVAECADHLRGEACLPGAARPDENSDTGTSLRLAPPAPVDQVRELVAGHERDDTELGADQLEATGAEILRVPVRGGERRA